MNNTILVTGGAGFIGSNFVLEWIAKTSARVVNLDLLTYAGNRRNLQSIENHPRHIFVQGDIADETLTGSLLREHQPRAILNFRPRATSTAPSPGPPRSFTPTSLEPSRSYNKPKLTGTCSRPTTKTHSASSTSPPTKFTEPCALKIRPSRRPLPTRRIVLTRPPRRPPTCLCARGITPTRSRCSLPTAPTTTGRINSRRSSSR